MVEHLPACLTLTPETWWTIGAFNRLTWTVPAGNQSLNKIRELGGEAGVLTFTLLSILSLMVNPSIQSRFWAGVASWGNVQGTKCETCCNRAEQRKAGLKAK